MKLIAILKYEAIHFIRSPFKIIAIILFVIASIYGIYNGANLYATQTKEIERIDLQAQESRKDIVSYFDEGKTGPEGRPWVNVTEPFWAMWYVNAHHFKAPSPLMIYSIGQAEQYGFYKKVNFNSSPYDSDMVEEIANPERLQTGYLDFSFALIYLLPLLVMICLYTIKGTEVDSGVLPLITTQISSLRFWLWARISFYAILVLLIIYALLFHGAFITNVIEQDTSGFISFGIWSTLYLLLWIILFGLIIQFGSTSISNTLKMVGLWLVLAFIIPGSIHQWVSTSYPTNLMTEFIDSQRDEKYELYDLPDSVAIDKLKLKFPEISNSVAMNDSLKRGPALSDSWYGLTNELTKQSLVSVEQSFRDKNNAIKSTYWINLVTFFQNKFNSISGNNFEDFQKFRDQVQMLIDTQLEIMITDTWNGVKVDKTKYFEYLNTLEKLNQ